MTSDRATRLVRAGLVLGIVLLAVPLAAHAYAGSFSRFMGDDYCDASTFRREGLLGAQKFFYNTWGAVPTTIALMALVDPAGPALAGWLPGIALFVWVATLAWAFAQFTPSLGIRPPRLLAVCLAEALVFATAEDAPNIVQSLYLRIPTLAYVCPVIALGGYIGFCRQAIDRAELSRGRAVASAVFAFVAGSFGPVYVAMQTTAVALALVASRVMGSARVRRVLTPALVAGVIGSVAALAFIAAAPGNTTRADFFPPRPGVLSIAKSTALATTFMLARPALDVLKPAVTAAVPRLWPDAARWLDRALAMASSPLIPMFVILLGALLALAVPLASVERATDAHARWWLVVIPIVAFILVAAAIVVGPFGTSAPPPPRALIIPQFALECLALAWGFAAGTIARSALAGRGLAVWRAVVPAAAIVIALIAVESARSTARTLTQISALRQWASDWDAGDRELRAAAREGRLHASAPALAPIGGVGAISRDATDWVNVCAAQYYGLATVTGR